VQGRGLGSTTLTVQAPGYNDGTSTITVGPSGFILNAGNINTNTFATNTTLRVDAALLNATTLNYQQSQALRGGLTVNVAVTSSDANVGTIVGTPAVFNAGDTVNFGTAFDPAASGTTTISLTTPAGFQTPNNLQSITATVTAPNISISGVTVGRDLQEAVSIFLGATPPSPVTVTVTGNNATIATITKDGTVAGGTSLTFTNVTSTFVGTIFVQGRGLGSTTLTVQAPGYNDGTSNITVGPSGFILNAGNINTNTFAGNTTLRIDAALLNATTLNYQQSQPLRGGLTASVAVTSSDTNVGTIVGSPAVFNANDTVNFGIAFNPATAGTTTISLTAPAGFQTPNNLQSITATVTAPNISISGATIGRDLQEGVTIFLGATPPSPVTVTVTSNNATIATITKDGTVAGGTSLTFTNVTTTTVGSFFVQGRGLGSTTLTVQAAGYNDGTSNITVGPSGFILNAGDLNTNTFAANTTLRVDAALLNATTLNYQQSQQLRGGLTANVDVTSSDTNVGTIVGSPAVFNAGDTVKFTVAFDPVALGTTTISLTTPAGFHTPSNLQSITATVNSPNISISNATIGRDLQEAVSIFLQSPPPSPVTVTVTSNNGAIATITKDGTVAGGTSLTFTNVTSTTVGTIFVQGRGLGNTTITVTAPGYTNGVSNVTVDPSGFILNIGSVTTTAGAANTALRIDAARLAPGTLTYQTSQPLRGGITVNVQVSSSNTAAGTIVGSPAVFNPGDTLNFGTAFDPAAQGSTTISLTTPAGFSTPSNLQSIPATVNP
jgi:subtilisin-like proprotein convertase family protein